MDKNVKNYTFIYFCKAADNSFASTPSFFFEASSLATTSDSQSDSGSSSPSTDPRRDSDLGLKKTYDFHNINSFSYLCGGLIASRALKTPSGVLFGAYVSRKLLI